MVGSVIARSLAEREDVQVTVLDARPDALARFSGHPRITGKRADLGDPAAVVAAIGDADVVVGALPSVLGYQTLEAVLEAGKSYVDISFMADDPMPLCELARARGVTAVVDCGIAPGVSNMLAGHGAAQLDRCDRVEIYVGGLPVERRWPFEYKAGFAPSDVIEEYVRPSRIVSGGKLVVRPALSEPELMDFPGVGTLEAFNTDGLRSLVDTLDVPDMVEKTLRYPGHIELMRVFRELGLFGTEPVDVKGQQVRPRDLMSALLFPKWTFEPGEADLTVMRVSACGQRGGKAAELRWDYLDRHDPATDTRSMSRSTAFPATIVAEMILDGTFPLGPGLYPPELPAREPGFVDRVLAGLRARGAAIIFSQ